MQRKPPDPFAALKDYDGYVFVFEGGYFAKFEFTRTEPRGGTHPWRYSLTLHAPSGKRLLGFDNAHPVAHKSGRFRRRTTYADHWHRDASDKGRPYNFTTPAALLEDFFAEAERTLKALGIDPSPQQIRVSK